jgi:hypothetical protein
MQSCKDQYLAKFPNLEIEEQSLMTHIRWIVNRQKTRDVSKEKSSRRLQVGEVLRERMEQNQQSQHSQV